MSPAFDTEFYSNGTIQEAVNIVTEFAESLGISGLAVHIYEEAGKGPLLVMVYEGNLAKNFMVYGHLDKQPHMEGWKEGTGAITPAVLDGKLYGRGVADDGYAPFAVLLAIKNAVDQGVELPRIAMVFESEEESGSPNLISLLETCSEWIQEPDLCICLDTGGIHHHALWLTSSVRGTLSFNLKVSITKEAIHSGVAGGGVPDTYRILNLLLKRFEDQNTGRIEIFEVEIPEKYHEEAK